MRSFAAFLVVLGLASLAGCESDPASSVATAPPPQQSLEPDAYSLNVDPTAGLPAQKGGEPMFLYYARCKKLHGNNWEWTSARTPDRSLAQQWSREHGDQYPGHRASVRRDRNR